MKSLKELSKELCKSPNDSSDKQISSHQLEYEIKTLENVIHEELANSKSVISPEKQAERLISHLRDTLVEVDVTYHNHMCFFGCLSMFSVLPPLSELNKITSGN